jgi:hypothetical protein
VLTAAIICTSLAAHAIDQPDLNPHSSSRFATLYCTFNDAVDLIRSAPQFAMNVIDTSGEFLSREPITAISFLGYVALQSCVTDNMNGRAIYTNLIKNLMIPFWMMGSAVIQHKLYRYYKTEHHSSAQAQYAIDILDQASHFIIHNPSATYALLFGSFLIYSNFRVPICSALGGLYMRWVYAYLRNNRTDGQHLMFRVTLSSQPVRAHVSVNQTPPVRADVSVNQTPSDYADCRLVGNDTTNDTIPDAKLIPIAEATLEDDFMIGRASIFYVMPIPDVS